MYIDAGGLINYRFNFLLYGKPYKLRVLNENLDSLKKKKKEKKRKGKRKTVTVLNFPT